MKKLTAKEILEVVEKHYSIESFAHNSWTSLKEDVPYTPEQKATIEDVKANKGNHWELHRSYILQNIGLGEVEVVDEYGGEGMGETWYSVKHFKDHDVYIRTNGYYQSYSGTEFYDGYGREVRPVTKEVVFYEA